MNSVRKPDAAPVGNRCHARNGVVLMETCVALALVGLVLGMVSLLVTQHERATDYLLNQRRLELAAESQIERMRAGVLPITDTAFTDEAGITYTIEVVAARQAWAPLKRVQVTAEVVGKHARKVRYELRTYVTDLPAGQGGSR